MANHFSYVLESVRERLWVKPALYALMALASIVMARSADALEVAGLVPDINAKVIESLVTIISASMLGVSTFAVASMVSAYAAASQSTTPRAFSLLVKDRASQNALSSFIGAFMFSVAGIVAIRMEYYGSGGRFVLFVLALAVMAWVVITFVRWVDEIARLGRLGNTMGRLEDATLSALRAWGPNAALRAVPFEEAQPDDGEAVYSETVGYVRHVDIEVLQQFAEKYGAHITVGSTPGAHVPLTRPLLQVRWDGDPADRKLIANLREAFVLGDMRTFNQDPRLGLISLSEIASRSLSPAINDPGTAIGCITRLIKVLSLWQRDILDTAEPEGPRYERVHVSRLSVKDLFEDGFGAIARDGTGFVEVGIRLQKGLEALAHVGEGAFRSAAQVQARRALARAEAALSFQPDLERVRAAASWLRG